MLIQAPNRSIRLATTWGAVMQLAPNEQRELGGAFVAMALQAGCLPAGASFDPEPEDEAEPAELEFGSATVAERFAAVDPDPEDEAEPVELSETEARSIRIQGAIRELIGRNDPLTLTYNGQPKVRDVAVVLGEQVTRLEVETAFLALGLGD